MTLRVVSQIEHCNNHCPYFYYKYEDKDNIWCGRLNKRIFDSPDDPKLFWDMEKRDFPEECPLDVVM